MIGSVITNAKVRTMDVNQPEAQAVAISGNRIAAVGSNTEILKLAGSHTRLIDASNCLVLPGFNDAHLHFLDGGFLLSSLDLTNVQSIAEFSECIGRYAEKSPRGRWITGYGWDHERWPGSPLPSKELIDGFTRDVPMLLYRVDGHSVLANTSALKLAGVSHETKDPPGGSIVRDPKTGEATGILKDAAMGLVLKVVPSPSFEEKSKAAINASQHAVSLGVTSVQDMSANDDVGMYKLLMQRGEVKTRIYAARPLTRWQSLANGGGHTEEFGDMLRTGALKAFSDGSLGSSTALFFDAYEGAPDSCGLYAEEMFPEGAMLRRILDADRAGLHVLIHAIGDKANSEVLGFFEEVARVNGPRDRRCRIEHAQHLRPRDIGRFARAGVIASVQPCHCVADGCWAEKRIGAERCKTTYAFRSLIDAGASLALGTDWPVAPLDPLRNIMAAVTRQTLDGKHPGGWMAEQKISIEEAARAYTLGAAHAEFADAVKGSITKGKLADLVILDRDIFTIPATEIAKAQVRMTIIDGQVAYQND